MLSPEYRISEAESGEALRMWLDEKGYNSLSDEDRNTVDVLMDAEKIGRWPVTVSEVHAEWERERQERERKRIASWRDEGRMSDFDFSEYAQQVADGLDGPFVTFMRMADKLRQAGMKQLTVEDVRVTLTNLIIKKEKK
jgi:hypothetical protein